MFSRLISSLKSPVDAASLVAFRIGFGLIAAAWAADYLYSGRVDAVYQAKGFHFTYYLFEFIRPWPGAGMRLHFIGLHVLALCIAAGFQYRLATLLFGLGFTYVFLLDRTNYQNHYYLLMLISWVLAIVPLNRFFALDALRREAPGSQALPAWCLHLMRFHVALPYFFGGIAKLNGDWFVGEPLRSHLLTKATLPFLGPVLASEAATAFLIWGGLLFDLAIVPLLLWRPTRAIAYVLCVGFHLTNACLFEIHVFPWFMILATTIFFDPGWPRRLLRRPERITVATGADQSDAVSAPSPIMAWLLATYCLLQLLLPFRHWLYSGNSNWTERGHHFSWRMMLRVKDSAIRYYVTDPQTGRTGLVDLRPFVTLEQLTKFSRDPEMILHLAHHIAGEFRRKTGRTVEVRALVLTSLNGRKPDLLIDPNVDLAKEPRGFHARTWITPAPGPLLDRPWLVPVAEWHRHVDLPPLPHLQKLTASEPQKTTALNRN